MRLFVARSICLVRSAGPAGLLILFLVTLGARVKLVAEVGEVGVGAGEDDDAAEGEEKGEKHGEAVEGRRGEGSVGDEEGEKEGE